MSNTFEAVKALVRTGKVAWSNHATDQAADDLIEPRQVEQTAQDGEVLEDYPTYAKGPCVLVLQWIEGQPIHVVWGIRQGTTEPAVVVTVYRPQPPKWLDPRTRGSLA